MSLHRNPEFLRNTWLELTPQRLLAMPAVLALILLVVALADAPGLPLANVAMSLFVLVVVLYGAKLAGDSMTEELVQGTWDSQRLSGLGAATMTAGKLLGGPVFAWYGGAFCMAAYVATSLDAAPYPVLRAGLIVVGIAVTLHALALLSNLMAWRKLPRSIPTQRSSGVMVLLALIFVPQLLAFMFSGREFGDVRWYAWDMPAADFALLCAALAAFWSVLGLYRTMREELAFRDPPTAWIAFLLFLFAFIGGWFHTGDAGLDEFTRGRPALAHLGACALVSLVATYCLLFGERKDWVKLRRIVALWQAGEVRRAFELTPKWLATFLLTVAVAAAFAVAALATQPVMEGIALACVAFGFLTFLVRDGALLLGLNFARDQRRADAAAALYLAVLYALVPGLLGGLGLEFLLPAFWPPMLQAQPPWLVLMLLQAAAALDFARRRWQQLPPAG
jgi:hypothetical protein